MTAQQLRAAIQLFAVRCKSHDKAVNMDEIADFLEAVDEPELAEEMRALV